MWCILKSPPPPQEALIFLFPSVQRHKTPGTTFQSQALIWQNNPWVQVADFTKCLSLEAEFRGRTLREHPVLMYARESQVCKAKGRQNSWYRPWSMRPEILTRLSENGLSVLQRLVWILTIQNDSTQVWNLLLSVRQRPYSTSVLGFSCPSLVLHSLRHIHISDTASMDSGWDPGLSHLFLATEELE